MTPQATAEPGDSARSRERRALLYALAAVGLWSTVATGFKLGLARLDPVQLLFLGCATATAFFALAALAASMRRGASALPTQHSRRQHLWAAVLGLVNPLAYYLVLFEAYDRLPAQVAQPLNYTWAIALALLAIPMLGQRLPWRGWLGVLIGYAGVVVLLTQGRLDGFGRFDPAGVALALLSTLLWAWYWIMTVRLGMAPLRLLLIGFSVATVLIAALCAATVGLPDLRLENLGYGAWVGLVEMGVAFLLWQRALALTARAGRIGQLIFLSPFLSLVLIATVLGETIHPSAVVALGLIVCGLVLSRR